MSGDGSSIGDLAFPVTHGELVRRLGSPMQQKRFRRKRFTAFGTALALVAAAVLTFVTYLPNLRCDWGSTGLEMAGGECVGVDDGSHSFDPGLDWITGRIHSMNRKVEERLENDGDLKAFRIVLMTSFSLSGDADLDQSQIERAVEGAYASLMRQNGFAENTDGSLETVAEGSRLFQLYLANEGSLQQGADVVVEQLEDMKGDEIPLSAVIGQSSTTTATESIARDLSERGIPMIASSSTSTTINNDDFPGLIRVAPNNEDYAAAIRGRLDAEDEAGRDPGRGMLLFDDNREDIFASDLAFQFEEYLDPYLVEHRRSFTGSAGREKSPVYFDHIINEICGRNAPDMVFFAGRFSYLEDFLHAWELRGCRTPDGDPITVYSIEIGLHPGIIGDYATECGAAEDEPAPGDFRLMQASAFDPAWLEEGGWRPEGFDVYREAMTGTVRGESQSTGSESDFYNGYSLIYYDAADIAVRATLLGHEAGDEDTLAESVRNHLFRVSGEQTGSGYLDFVEELDGRVTGRYVPIVSFPCVEAPSATVPFQTPDEPYDELYPDLK
ncbi:type 1 periplasmic-binding domain-containing protein [Salininema proteolyticum]|uniref:ABC-type branched-chain amino acid transport system, substrate-binding protein n=1 Tax=Salininema proteolyticum TaxID=1607685 RepID=A0ABV8U2U7_9ACTN